MHQTPERVEADLERADGTVLRVTADYLVAADGGRSTVRRAVGIPMTPGPRSSAQASRSWTGWSS
ncbi:FAD-dependent monooxygenase [Saccharothrix sp. ST-888]|uniref:FAD-dependent monooxygenase n=1 Tax=Saccharothrix sp. ST-888 TaxID=1427391 RepID=UPI001E60079D|nr:FAD-dependent monooxygenase [Saccharothrix sp. ST-888]